MTFKYTYRDGQGALKIDWIDAQTRQECSAALGARGIHPISITEGKRPTDKARGSRFGIGVVIAVLALAVTTWYFFAAKKKPQETPQQHPANVAEKKTPPVVQPRKTPQPKPSTAPMEAPAEPSHKHTGKLPAPSNLSDDVRAIKAASLSNTVAAVTNARPEPVFKTATEQLMSFIFNAEVGDMPPPLPTLPRNEMERIEEILNTPNLVKEGDSEDIAAKKQMLEQAKKELKDYMAQGGTPAEFLRFYHEQLKKYYQERQDAQKLVMTMIRDEPEVAGEFMKKVNQRLAERGIKAVHIPKPFLERAGIKAD